MHTITFVIGIAPVWEAMRTCLPGGAEMTTRTMTADEGGTEDFTTGEGLRALLRRLHEAGPDAWRTDPVAARLMAFAAEKYEALARKHGLDPWEAATAAFDVMRTRSAREAVDPWGVVTHAVRITCIFEERAQGLLCSVHQARRPHVSVFHDAERLSERDNPLDDYHSAFHTTDTTPDDEHSAEGHTSAVSAVEDAIAFMTLLGWPAAAARAGVEHVCQALARAGSRQSAFEVLRRDRHAQALLDLDGEAWSALLKTLLGNQAPGMSATTAGRGILLRLLIGETLPVLLHDDDLVLTVALAAPGSGRS